MLDLSLLNTRARPYIATALLLLGAIALVAAARFLGWDVIWLVPLVLIAGVN
jgi:hypothetical protein